MVCTDNAGQVEIAMVIQCFGHVRSVRLGVFGLRMPQGLPFSYNIHSDLFAVDVNAIAVIRDGCSVNPTVDGGNVQLGIIWYYGSQP